MDVQTSGNAHSEDALTRERAELERRAYGRRETPAGQLDARLAQEALIELSRLETPLASELVAAPPEPEPSEQDADKLVSVQDFTLAAEDARPRKKYGRGILILAIIGAFAAGAGITAGIAAANRTVAVPAGPASSTVANPLPGTNFPVVNVGSADRWFSTSQTAADKYPNIPVRGMEFVPSSTRLVENSNVIGSVWVARSSTPANGYCLMMISPEASDRTRSGEAQCASATTFLAKGLTLQNNGVSVRWTSTQITATALP
jgi:hypothetical protein